MAYKALLIHTCYIGTKTTTYNEFGEPIEDWTYSSEPIICRFQPINLSDRVEMGGRFEDIRYKVFFEEGVSVYLDSRIKYNNEYYVVNERYYDSSGHHITCLVAELI